MSKRKGRLAVNRIRRRRAYTLQDLADLLETHIRTVQGWKKEGLLLLDPTLKPALVMGQAVRDFLKARSRKRKHPLAPGQFFCTRCRVARDSKPEFRRTEITGRRLGLRRVQVLECGICDACGLALIRFSSTSDKAKGTELDGQATQRQEAIRGDETPSVNTDIEEVKPDA